MAKYTVQQHSVDTLLTWVRTNQIAIPEMQRPFVWDSIKVRDLVDSLYKGYPVGYLITWQSVGVGLRGGASAAHQQILIDGQQRITAMTAALVGLPVVNKQYKKSRITIAFHPVREEFATLTPVIAKDPQWVHDIAEVVSGASLFGVVRRIVDATPEVAPELIEERIQRLQAIKHAQLGVIVLADDLDIETVTEIFIRINSKGVALSAADFAMSKIASYGEQGSLLRKLIDYFCELSAHGHVYDDIMQNDEAFATSKFASKLAWLRNESEDLYDPSYADLVRVASIAGFRRGRPAALVSHLSGRDFDTRTSRPELMQPAFDQLEEVLLRIVSDYKFKQFMTIIRSAGFVSPKMVSSKNALNFAYALYLILSEDASMNEAKRKRIVRRWFVMSMLTGRHSGSFESTWDADLRRIEDNGAAAVLERIEQSDLGESFWTVTLPDQLATATQGPAFKTFLAAQVYCKAPGFLSRSVTVQDMLQEMGDIHHIVPKDYLIKSGITDRNDYNQVANYVMAETPVNITISNKVPGDYLALVHQQIDDKQLRLGEIRTRDELTENFQANAVPASLETTTAATYREFLEERRLLMATLIRQYYENL